MDNIFINNLYKEFERNSWTVLGFGIEGIEKTLNRPGSIDEQGYNIEETLKEALKEGGAPQLRWQMKNVIMNLHYIFLSRAAGRNVTFQEWVDSIETFHVGIDREDMDPSYLEGIKIPK